MKKGKWTRAVARRLRKARRGRLVVVYFYVVVPARKRAKR
jgi:hypothetical protein